MFHYEASWLETVLGEKGHIFLGKQTIQSSEDTGSSEAINCNMQKLLALELICRVGGSELVFEALVFAEHAEPRSFSLNKLDLAARQKDADEKADEKAPHDACAANNPQSFQPCTADWIVVTLLLHQVLTNRNHNL